MSLSQHFLGAAALSLASSACINFDAADDLQTSEADDQVVVATSILVTEVSFPGPDGITLSAVMYKPAYYPTGDYAAVVMMHGCSGMWSSSNPDAVDASGRPNLQNHIDKWGLKLAGEGIVALAVDSFTNERVASAVPDPDYASNDFQHQCAGDANAGKVDPYTERADDATAARLYLRENTNIRDEDIAVLGWSHGAQAAMVEVAVSTRDDPNPKDIVAGDPGSAATVLFYPGCGNNLGFGDVSPAVDMSWWRPLGDVRLNMGALDSFAANCDERMRIARDTYGAVAEYLVWAGVGHSFDAASGSQAWPTSCSTAATCAELQADELSLAFLLERIEN